MTSPSGGVSRGAGEGTPQMHLIRWTGSDYYPFLIILELPQAKCTVPHPARLLSSDACPFRHARGASYISTPLGWICFPLVLPSLDLNLNIQIRTYVSFCRLINPSDATELKVCCTPTLVISSLRASITT
jgi:hypothetical protein